MTKAYVRAEPSEPAPQPALLGGHPQTPGVSSSQLATEIVALDQAKHAVKAGDATRALHLLDSYDVSFPHGALAPESSALRIEALVRAGHHTEAMAALTTFRTTHPQSPLLTVLSGLVDGS